MPTLIAIATTPECGEPMVERDATTISTEHGLTDDARGKPGPRQVTVLSRQAWNEACAELGTELPWTLRRANLLLDDASLVDSIGRRLRIGSIVLEIEMETKPCGIMDKQHEGLRSALVPAWRGGVCCRVIAGGDARVGDTVTLE